MPKKTTHSAWQKAGWRSLLHRNYPKAVVRFGNDGPKFKLLIPHKEFNQTELGAGRDPEVTIRAMTLHAIKIWKEMGEK